MSYRKLKIDDKEYEYVIGRKFTKVKYLGKSFGLYFNNIHGNQIINPLGGYGDTRYKLTDNYVVTPENVKRMILCLPKPTFKTREGETEFMMVDPFDIEIEGKITYRAYSRSSYDTLADDI